MSGKTSEEAEREHCRQVALRDITNDNDVTGNTDMLMHERAAAREDLGQEHARVVEDYEWRLSELRDGLAALIAKHARLVAAARGVSEPIKRADGRVTCSSGWQELATLRAVITNEPPAERHYSTAAVDAACEYVEKHARNGAFSETLVALMQAVRASREPQP
jgi:hypothetical protein